MIKVTTKGSWKNTEKYLQRIKKGDYLKSLDRYGPVGVAALKAATPIDESKAANSWTYSIIRKKGSYSIVWRNTDIEGGAPIVILLQYGHGTRRGGYVPGRDFINPAIRPVFDDIVAAMWKEVTK